MNILKDFCKTELKIHKHGLLTKLVRSRWQDIGQVQVVFLLKKGTGPISGHLDAVDKLGQ